MKLTTRHLAPHRAATLRKPLQQQIWSARWCYLFMVPNLILAVMFTFYPTVASWYFSMLDWSGLTAERTWVGFANYREVISDSYFWDAFRRSFLFMLASVPIRLTLALIVAIVLNDQSLKLAPIFRTLFFLPVVTTAAIVGIVMTFVFSPFNGPVNTVLLGLGLIQTPIDFLGNPATALWTVMVVFIWKNFGITMIYWLAALQVIPRELYEAARIDGSHGWQLHASITVPLLIPFAIVILLITVVSTLHVFPIVQTMTGGGPFFASEVMEVYIYRTAFGTDGVPRLGYASAAAVFFGVTIMVLSLFQVLAVRRGNAFRQQLRVEGEQ